jgi:hypothetical protein
MHREIATNTFRVDFIKKENEETVWSSDVKSSEIRRLYYMVPFCLSPRCRCPVPLSILGAATVKSVRSGPDADAFRRTVFSPAARRE